MIPLRKQTAPKTVAGNGLRNPFTNRKRFDIECGECGHGYSDKVLLNETVSSLCPCCGAQNKFSLSAWIKLYDAALAQLGRQ